MWRRFKIKPPRGDGYSSIYREKMLKMKTTILTKTAINIDIEASHWL